MRNLVASSIRRWRLPLAPNLASADGASEQIVATCYDAESRVTYAVTDACNLYGVRDSAREGDDAELCLEMCLVESVPSATDAFDTRDVADDAVGNDARAGVDGDEKDDERNHLASPRTDEASEAPSNPNEPPLALVGEGPEDGPASSEVSAYQPALREASPIVGAAFVDDLRGVCVACATGELLLVAPDPEDDDEGMAPGAILTKDMAPECVGRVAQGLRAMRWNPDGELLVLATWAGTLILMTKEFRVLAEAPVGGGGGDGVASLSWRGDGQFLASLVAVRGGEPQLRVWEREDLTFHATGESLRPARISAGDPRGNCPSGDTFESSSGKTEKLSLPHAPPLAWQPRGALVAVACAPQRAREDSDVDSTSASDALDEEARVSRRDAKNESSKNEKKRPPPLPATEAEIVFFERNGLRRGSFRLPARGAGVEVTSLAWSCDSERLAVCVADPEAAVFEKKSRSGSGEDGDEFRGDFGAATQIWRRGNGKWYLSREVRFSTREGPKVYCAWDLSNPDVLRIATPNGRVEEHVFADEISVSSAATTATIDGADVLVTPMARAVIPPPMCAATVAFPATVADVCFCPASAVRTSFAATTEDAAFSEGQNRFAPRGEAVLALLSDGRLAIASAHRLTEWEETVELLADENDELEYGKETSHLHHGPDADVLLKLEAGVVRPVGGVFSILERAEDVPRRVAWLDANTALVAADRPSDGSASLLMVKLSFREARDDDDDLTSPRRAGSGNMSSRLAEPRWSCEVVSVTDLPASANAIARAEGENPAGAFVQMQTRCVDASPSASNDSSHAPTSLFASAAEDEHGDPTLSAVETSWPSASLPRACVALVALPPAKRGAPPTLAGLDARGVLRCGEHVVARDVRSFAAHFGDIGDDTLPFSSKAAEKKEEAPYADAALASASAYAKRWRAWSADDASPSLTRPEARLVYATNSDELRVVELAEVLGEASENGSDPLAATDGGGDFSGVFPSAENGNAFAAAAGGTRGFSIERDSRGDSRGVSSVRQNDRMHVSMRAAMRPADADRGIDSRTRRIEAGARIVAAPPGGVDVVLQMPRGNLETVAPRFLVLPAVARALDERRFAAAAAVATRHRVDLNLIVDRGWPSFLRHADAFVRDVDDPDVVAELLESLDAGDCTAPGKPYARLAPPTEAGDVSDVFGVDGESLAANGDETQAQAEDEDEATRPNGLLTSPSVDLVAVARSALADDARASASSRRPTNEGGNSRNSQELASGSSPGTDPDFVSAADEAAAKARRDDPRGKIRLTCSAIARAVARVAAEKARKASSRAASSPFPRRGDESRETKGEAFSSRVAYTVVEPAEELGFPEPPPRVAVDAAKSPPVAVSVARFEGMAVASATERAERKAADPPDAGGGARDDTVVQTLSRRLHETTKLSPKNSDTSAAFLSPSPTPPSSDSDSRLFKSAEDVDIDRAAMRMDVDALLPDRWELVMLSAHARSVPPDLEGALSRVRRRREAEIENARDAEAARDASVVSGTRTEAAKNARLANAIDRVSSMNRDVDSEAALDHLLALEGGKNLFDAAMGTYDLSTAFLVGQRAPGMDPGEYVPELERLQALPLSLRKADVDVRLGRWRSAVENLLKGGEAERACVLAAKRRLFPHAMAVAMEHEREEEMSLQANKDEKDDTQKVSSVSGLGGAGGLRGRRVGNSTTAPRSTTVSPLRVAVATAYAGQLNEERRHEDAAVALLSVGDLNGAMKAYADGLNWRPALALAGRLGLDASQRRALASELTDALEQFDPAGAAAVAERELGDVDRAASLLCAAKKWRETVSVAYAHGRGDLVETVVAPAAAEAASGVVSSAREAPARAEKYLERLRKLRERREALERALGADAGTAAASAGGAVGRPGATRDDDDDGASVFSAAASVSTLASGVSGFSAYTDRTLGAATATTGQTGTSRSASTVGGRVGKKKPTRAERRGKKAGAGLRAGGPTEERDLANHLASGGVAGDLLAPGALEHVGELSELLVVLGHAEDAAKLQGAVSAAIAAHHKASAEARRALDALDAKDAKDGLLASPDSGGDVSANAANANAFANNSTGRKIVPCPCAACVAHRSTHCLAAKNAQWKWAALRDAPLPKKKKATVWDDVAETAKELCDENVESSDLFH